MLLALDKQGLTPNFAFFQNRAGFEIGERPDWYSADSSYWQAFQVGLINTLRVVVAGLFSATFLGILVGVFLLSSNWLVRTISRVYVELLRNTPLLVQLFVFYFIGVLSLPVLTDAIAIPPEGVSLIPIRLAMYAVLLILILRRYPTGERLRFPALLALAATVGALEFAFAWQIGHPGWLVAEGTSQSMRGELGYAPFLVYAIGSVLLIGAAWFLPQILVRFRSTQPEDEIVLSDDGQPTFLGMEYTQLRSFLLALLGGQLLGGLLYYFGIMPDAALRTEIYPAIYLSNRGIFLPELITTSRFTEWLAFVGLGLLAAAAIWAYYGRIMETTGRAVPRMRLAILALVGCAVIGWFLAGVEPSPETIVVSQDGQAVVMPLEDAPRPGPPDPGGRAGVQPFAADPRPAGAPGLAFQNRHGNHAGIHGPVPGPDDLYLGLHRRDRARGHPGGALRPDRSGPRPGPQPEPDPAHDRAAPGPARDHSAAGQPVPQPRQKLQPGDRDRLRRFLPDRHDGHEPVRPVRNRHCGDDDGLPHLEPDHLRRGKLGQSTLPAGDTVTRARRP